MSTNKVKTLPPIENPALEKAIQALKEGSTPEKQQALNEAIKAAKLLSPCAFDVKESGKEGTITAENVKFFMINTNDGRTFFPVYTHMSKTGQVKFGEEKPKFVVNPINIYGKLLQDANNKATGVVINPGFDNIIMPRNLVLMLAGVIQPAPETNTPKPTQPPMKILFQEPTVYPTQMATAVYDLCEKKENVERVWLKQKLVGQELGFVLVVEAKDPDQKLYADIQACAVSYSKDIPVEIVAYSEQAEKLIVNGTVALYDKSLAL